MSTPLLETRAHLEQMKTMLETMKKQQQMRGLEQLNKRMAERVAKGNSWRQLKGIDSIMYEIKHPGNVHTVVGLGYVLLQWFSSVSQWPVIWHSLLSFCPWLSIALCYSLILKISFVCRFIREKQKFRKSII